MSESNITSDKGPEYLRSLPMVSQGFCFLKIAHVFRVLLGGSCTTESLGILCFINLVMRLRFV